MSVSFSRPNWAEINLSNLRHNAQVLAQSAAPARLICVIKAGAYGHGALPIARALSELPAVAMLAVASVDEGAQLRQGGIETPILLLSALLPGEIEDAARANLTPTIWTSEIAAAWNEAAGEKILDAHFKVDTGMARLGVKWCEATARWRELQGFSRVRFGGVYTHLACADETDDEFSNVQLARFENFLDEAAIGPDIIKHAANSAAALRYPRARFDLVRPGLPLYGAHPCPESCLPLDLRPVMTWKSRVTALQNLAAGESVSYGATWRAARASRIAVVACGYADGYLRAFSKGGEVSIGGARFPLAGRVTMDQIMVDTTESARPIEVGDEVVLWGEGLPVEQAAARAGTIPWELLCAVSARVPRIYL